MKHRVLVITDHSGHSDQNSIYSLLKAMQLHKQCEWIDVVSRGNHVNSAFFDSLDDQDVQGTRITSEFSFSADGKYFVEGLSKVTLQDYTMVFMRLPRPVKDSWLLGLKRLMNKVVFINDPSGIVLTSNKKFLLNFPDQCPNMILCKSVDDIKAFSSKFPIVLKPLKEYGGKGIVKIDGDSVDVGGEIVDLQKYLIGIENELYSTGYLAMKFLKNVRNGDKRILVVNNEIMGSSLRIPASGAWLCNVAQGGTSVKCDVTKEEIEMIKAISPILTAEGIVIYGADTIEDDNGKRILSEINTLSIGGFPQAQEQSGKPIIKWTIDKLFTYANEYK